MHFVTVGSESIGHLPLEAQAEAMEHELNRINRELPLRPVIDARRQSMVENGNPYATPYDQLMWNIVGDPYEMFGPKKWQPTEGGSIQYGYHFFTGLSDDDEILSVDGAVEQHRMHEQAGYRVHSLHLPKGPVIDWSISSVELSPPAGTYDVRLNVGHAALEGLVYFRTPSRSDASFVDQEGRVHYSRDRLKNLYVVVKAFDAKYRHLEVLYLPEQNHADVVPLVNERPIADTAADSYTTAA